jgi:hypothetical protein
MSKRITKRHHHWHHRKPRSLGGTNANRNMAHVPSVKHEAWHLLFSNYNPYQIAMIINNTWLDSDYELVVVKKDPYGPLA